ncbi:hypothetical protein D8Y22_05030 [Salinadaptatus halalkaliphilus]|uniref:Uncharacterized protein n=1 Tax=Salinadaptatus halalkaliphilus TaxID=2419781 RepID=A0A4S3TNP9_9EURY|nr:hypothetical protein [Salinadaptatus halalkaliphilus]THE65891.1 hypothetical protein D8Y22_05030 [Salinadaptatus halalkaliphilus]
MARTVTTTSLHRFCKRYGPGRLPKADDDSIGAGYAAATAAVVATVAFGLVMVGADFVVAGAFDGTVLAALGLSMAPIVGPLAFVVGVVIWRHLPSETPYYGFTAGFLGTVVTYVGAFLVGCILLVSLAALSVTGTDPVAAGAFAVGVADVGFRLTAWLTVPIGCASGYLYETVAVRSRVPS